MEGMKITIRYGNSSAIERDYFDPSDNEPSHMIGHSIANVLGYCTQAPILNLAYAVLNTADGCEESVLPEFTKFVEAAYELCAVAANIDNELNGPHSTPPPLRPSCVVMKSQSERTL